MRSRSEVRDLHLSGLVRVAETGAPLPDLRVGIEQWPSKDANQLIAAVSDAGVSPPADTGASVGSARSSADGEFELATRVTPDAGTSTLLTVRPATQPGPPQRPLFVQALGDAAAGRHAFVIELPTARLLRAEVRVKREAQGTQPVLTGLMQAARERELAVRPPAQRYSQRYAAQLDAAQAHEADRISAPRHRGPSLAVAAVAGAAGGPSLHDIATALAQLAVPAERVVAPSTVRVDLQADQARITPPRLPLKLRKTDATPDPFAQRLLEVRWTAALAAERGTDPAPTTPDIG